MFCPKADHREYVKEVQEVKAVQKKVMGAIAHQRYRVKQVSDEIKMLVQAELC